MVYRPDARGVVNEPVNHRGQQIYFGIAATVGHDADLACNFERNPAPCFRTASWYASIPKLRWYVLSCMPRGLIGVVPFTLI